MSSSFPPQPAFETLLTSKLYSLCKVMGYTKITICSCTGIIPNTRWVPEKKKQARICSFPPYSALQITSLWYWPSKLISQSKQNSSAALNLMRFISVGMKDGGFHLLTVNRLTEAWLMVWSASIKVKYLTGLKSFMSTYIYLSNS